MIAATPTNGDVWMIVAIGLLLVVLTFLSLAEMALSRMSKPRAAALAEKGVKSGKALVKLANEPTRWINQLLLTINVCQTVQATLTGVVSGRLF
ncbi:MAG: CNNM domain-containing protein, partial [Actinomycetota bacterium]